MAAPPDFPDSSARHWHRQELALLDALVRRLGDRGTPDPLLHDMLQLMSELLGLNRGRIVLRAGETLARIGFAYGLTRAEIARGLYAPGEGITGHVLQTGQAIVVPDIDTEPRFLARSVARRQLTRGGQAFLALPVQAGAHTLGVLACHRDHVDGRTLDDDLALLRILAALAGQRLRLLEQATAAVEPNPGAPLVRPYLRASSHTAEQLERTLAEHQGHQQRAAQALGLTLRQFNYRLRKARGG